MRSSKMNMINIHTLESKTEYILYIPDYYFKNSEMTLESMSQIIKTSKQLLTEYIMKGKIVCAVVTDELLEPSFPAIHPKMGNEKNFKFNPLKVININN